MDDDTITLNFGTLGNKISENEDYENLQQLERSFKSFVSTYNKSRKAKDESALSRNLASLKSVHADVESLLTAFTSNNRYSQDPACMDLLDNFAKEVKKR
jgi:hypothetical protein